MRGPASYRRATDRTTGSRAGGGHGCVRKDRNLTWAWAREGVLIGDSPPRKEWRRQVARSPWERTARVPGKTPPDASGAGLTPDPQEPSDVPATDWPASPGRARCHPAAMARIPARESGPSSRFGAAFHKAGLSPESAVLRRPTRFAFRGLFAPPASAKRPWQRSRLGRGRSLAGPSSGPSHLRPWGAETGRPGSAGLGAEAACSVQRIAMPIPTPRGARRARFEKSLRIPRARFGLLDLRSRDSRPARTDRLAPAVGRRTQNP